MLETLMPVELPPGIRRNGTAYQSKNAWYDAHLVRFWSGTKRPVGGWRRAKNSSGTNLSAVSGVPRAVISWLDNSGAPVIGIATTSKLYVLTGGALFDVTPVGFTTGRTDAAYAAGTGLFGKGPFGVGAFGKGSLGSTLQDADTWTLDVFGQYLVGVSTSDQKLYVWQNNTATPAAVPAGAPTTARAVVVTPERFLFALGVNGDPRTVAWPSQESITDWTPSGANTAGDFPLSTTGVLMCGQRTSQETLLWTSVDLWAARYLGADPFYSFTQVGDGCGIIAPNAKVVVETSAIWMGRNAFYSYNGYVQQIPCDVADYVFSDMNTLQAKKIFAVRVPQFGEVWWFYPSSGSSTCDRYVVYNYIEKHWTIGKLARVAGVGADATSFPVLLDSTGVVWEHEAGIDHGGDTPYLESGPIELGNGDQVMKLNRFVPDDRTTGDLTLVIYSSLLNGPVYPDPNEKLNGPFAIARPTDVRITARQVRLRFQTNAQTIVNQDMAFIQDKDWRLGTPRLGVRAGGRR